MTGLEKIVNQILEEANTLAEEKKAAGKAEAEQILSKAKEDAKKTSEEILKRSEADVANYKERIKSSNDLSRRTAILEAKQELIGEVIEKAYQEFCAKEDTKYWEIITSMLSKFSLAEEGEVYFSKRDLDRMPTGFEEEIAKIADTKGGKLSLSKETRNLDGGFVLAYGGIEENCSFKAMFDSKKDDLQDQVQKILFS
ncbi:hypothetical protein LJC18_01530 [Lachnospiraceae bacterium OttesenSCG-928-E19]|nr:hypothetical protein [Lachnospiraceae bacterium OttesenSCG-928-E19]